MPAVKSSAVAAVASELGYADGHTPPAGEKSGQADLLRAWDDDLALFEGAAVKPAIRRGPGRPVGSVNRTTRQLQAYLVARGYRDPAEFLASLVSADTIELARTLGIEDRAEVLKIQRAAAVDLLPYFHQRQGPTEAERAPQARPLVMISMGAAGAVETRPDGMLSIHDLQRDQQVSVTVDQPSHDMSSQDDSQGLDDAK